MAFTAWSVFNPAANSFLIGCFLHDCIRVLISSVLLSVCSWEGFQRAKSSRKHVNSSGVQLFVCNRKTRQQNQFYQLLLANSRIQSSKCPLFYADWTLPDLWMFFCDLAPLLHTTRVVGWVSKEVKTEHGTFSRLEAPLQCEFLKHTV